jgi:hypothetical protein
MNYYILTALIGSLLVTAPFATAEEPPTHRHGDPPTNRLESGSNGGCWLPQSHGVQAESGRPVPAVLEGVQIETEDIGAHELFFETILGARRVLHHDHPEKDRFRGYCYRGVLIVVRQDLKIARPTGWVQVNFAVADVSSIKEQLEQALQRSSVAQRDEAEREKIVRIRLKADVPRSDCRAIRLEVSGPEGFLIGFDQFKAGTCKSHEHPAEGGASAAPK